MMRPWALSFLPILLLGTGARAELKQEDCNWLREFTISIIKGATITLDDSYRSGHKITVVTPGGPYKNVFLTDYLHTCECRLVPIEQMKETVDYLTLRYAGHYMGTVEKGWKSFRHPKEPSVLGKDRLLSKEGWTESNPQDLVKLVWVHWKLSGDLSLFQRRHQLLAEYLLGHNGFYVKKNGLVFLDEKDVMDPKFVKRGYGFYDTVQSTGYNLFASLLLWDAYTCLGEMYSAAGEETHSQEFHQRADHIAEAFVPTFFDKESNLLLSATGVNRQPDVWGSAFAVTLGVLDEEHEQKVTQALADLVEASKEKPGMVWRGQVRHMVAPGGWQRAEQPLNRYQNGAYWGMASGWLFRAVRRMRPDLAEWVMQEMIADYRARGTFECIHPTGKYTKGPGFVNSVTQPLGALMEEGYYEDVRPLLSHSPTDNSP